MASAVKWCAAHAFFPLTKFESLMKPPETPGDVCNEEDCANVFGEAFGVPAFANGPCLIGVDQGCSHGCMEKECE